VFVVDGYRFDIADKTALSVYVVACMAAMTLEDCGKAHAFLDYIRKNKEHSGTLERALLEKLEEYRVEFEEKLREEERAE